MRIDSKFTGSEIKPYDVLQTKDEPTIYLKRIVEGEPSSKVWNWPVEDLSEKVEAAEAVDETFRGSGQSGVSVT